MSLNKEIQEKVSSMNLPEEVIQVVSRSIIDNGKGKVQGLPVGSKAPDFILNNASGDLVRLSDQLKKGQVVLSFFRGEWCPFCSLELLALNKIEGQIKSLNGHILSVHPQRIANSLSLTTQFDLKFEILSDPNQEVLEAYRVRFDLNKDIRRLYLDTFGFDLGLLNANGEWNLPVPATYIIDQQGIIRYRHYDHDYMERMEPQAILDALRELHQVAA
ncbi:MAG: peroxiredoxin-like family protein [Bacteroidota bacterium]